MRMDIDHETEVRRKVTANLRPGIARIIGPHDSPLFLQKQEAASGKIAVACKCS